MTQLRSILGSNSRYLFLSLLGAWFLLNLLQAVFTEIISDEAYYMVYGQHLDWGYFDHPPAVAVLTHVSSLLFRGNLGIRFMTVLLQPLCLVFIWRTIDDKAADAGRILIFFMIAASVSLFAAYGFFTTPDAPLLFFTAFFLWAYREFLRKADIQSVFLLSLAMAGLLYSKYHGFLVIAFIIIAKPRILTSSPFITALCIAFLIFTPHIWWQAVNNFPSLRFHLVDRAHGISWDNFIEYIPNQLAAFNPVVFGAAIYIIVHTKGRDDFERALVFIVAGFLIFFGFSAARMHVEPQWTIAASIPLIILLYDRCLRSAGLKLLLVRCLVPVLVLIFAARILLMTNLHIVNDLGFAGKKDKYQFIGKVAGDVPVIFTGSYQDPALYSFFTGKEGVALSSLFTRKTQYDLLQLECTLQNKPVFVYGYEEGRSRLYTDGVERFYGYFTDSLQTVNRMVIRAGECPEEVHPGEFIEMGVRLRNPYGTAIDFNHRLFPVRFCAAFVNGKKIVLEFAEPDGPIEVLDPGGTAELHFRIKIPGLLPAEYKFGICLRTPLGPVLNDSFSRLNVYNY
jgi:hypothetical protein